MSKITEKIKTFEDACEVLGINAAIPDFSAMPERYQKPMFALYQLTVIAEALNEGWKPDWSNGKWDKWFPWFWFNKDNGSSSASRFSFFGSIDRCSDSFCGSRLCYKSEELSDYAGTQFEDLYREAYVLE